MMKLPLLKEEEVMLVITEVFTADIVDKAEHLLQGHVKLDGNYHTKYMQWEEEEMISPLKQVIAH
jgi:hypothetical protein